jgi:CheY-like chemotaxis protein
MKLLVASCFDDLPNKIAQQLDNDGVTADLTHVQGADEIVDALTERRYDGLLADYAISDLDIWKLSALLQSTRFAEFTTPLYLIWNEGDPDIPLILANEYQFTVVSLGQIAEALLLSATAEKFKPSLLIIEDDPAAANVAFHALKDSYQIDIVKDGQSGLVQWQTQRHDLILLDLMLPGLSGDQVLSQILAIDNDQPVIIVTAFADGDHHKQLMINGASEFLGKPYSLDELRRLCQMVYHRAKLVSEIHYREDKFQHLSHQLWLLTQCLANDDMANSHSVMQRIQSIIPVAEPSDDERIKLLRSVSPR